VEATYSDICDTGGVPWPGAGNICANPVFVDAAGGDYHLRVGSPCINAGTNAGAPSDDIDGDARPWPPAGAVDIGADEWSGACAISYSPAHPVVDEAIAFDSGVPDPGGVLVSVSWDFGDGATGVGATTTHAYAAPGTYTATATVCDKGGGGCLSCSVAVEVSLLVAIALPEPGWHMISLPLEPVDKSILLDRATGEVDPSAIFYSSSIAGNDPRGRLFRIEAGVGYWAYNPDLFVAQSWYEVGVEPPPGLPDPGPWWQGFWFLVDVPHTVTYTAYGQAASDARFMDISSGPGSWAWIMMGACARVSEPYDPDVTTWPLTSMVTDLTWGASTPPTEPTTWIPTSDCGLPDAWDTGLIGLPLSGYDPGVGYYTVSPSQTLYCGAPTPTDSLTPGEGYWLDVEDLSAWLKVSASP
jgi:PKD repeat protein